MGFFGYNRKFVKDYARIAKPLYALLNKDSKFVWTERCQESFDLLKQRIADSVPSSASPTLTIQTKVFMLLLARLIWVTELRSVKSVMENEEYVRIFRKLSHRIRRCGVPPNWNSWRCSTLLNTAGYIWPVPDSRRSLTILAFFI